MKTPRSPDPEKNILQAWAQGTELEGQTRELKVGPAMNIFSSLKAESGWLEYYICRISLLGGPIFRGYLSFREGKFFFGGEVRFPLHKPYHSCMHTAFKGEYLYFRLPEMLGDQGDLFQVQCVHLSK